MGLFFPLKYGNFWSISSAIFQALVQLAPVFFFWGVTTVRKSATKTLVRMVICVLHIWFIARFGSIFLRKNAIFSASFYGWLPLWLKHRKFLRKHSLPQRSSCGTIASSGSKAAKDMCTTPSSITSIASHIMLHCKEESTWGR